MNRKEKEELISNLYWDMALTDFIICNTDRHLNNFGVIRDSRTLRFTKLASIFDSGNSMMYKTPDQAEISLSLHEKTNGFYRSYKNSIEYVSDPSIVDTSKLPSMEDILRSCIAETHACFLQYAAYISCSSESFNYK